MQILEIDHIGIEVKDLGRAEDFYTRVLGLSIAARFGDQILLQCGRHRVGLFENPQLVTRGEESIKNPFGKGHHAFRVSREEFQAAMGRLSEQGVPTYGPVDWGDHECLYFLDPDGNLLEIVNSEK